MFLQITVVAYARDATFRSMEKALESAGRGGTVSPGHSSEDSDSDYMDSEEGLSVDSDDAASCSTPDPAPTPTPTPTPAPRTAAPKPSAAPANLTVIDGDITKLQVLLLIIVDNYFSTLGTWDECQCSPYELTLQLVQYYKGWNMLDGMCAIECGGWN